MGSNQKINICHLASGDLWAGAEVQIFTLLSQLNKLPTLNISAVILNDGELFKKLTESGIDVYLIDEKHNGFFSIVNDVGKYLNKKQIDLVHSHRYKENILAAQLKKKGITPYIIQTIHGESEPFVGINRIKALISTFLNRHYTKKYFNCVVTVSDVIRSRTENWFDHNKLITIHNAIDLHHNIPTRGVAEIKSELKIDTDRKIIGTAGRLVPIKGYDILLETAHILCESSPETVFVLAGDGPLREKLETKCKELNLSDNFMFLGFRKDILNLMNMFDIFIMSSHNEGIPITLLDAMSLSKPVVAPAVGGIPEVVIDGQTGFLVKPSDPHALSKACLELLANHELRREFGDNGKKRIEAEFQVPTQAEHVNSVYCSITSS